MIKKKLKDEEVPGKFSSIIDNLMAVLIVSAHKFLELLLNIIPHITSDAVDKKVNILKEKIKNEKGKNEKESSDD